ncbi:DUF2188 domain-containing protein [Natronomonas sp.]|uniref:DUF2188 domain-containing protein n=1 Tax=Natronomonas sp. TaxID=2184060 RepID=UPI002FC347A2
MARKGKKPIHVVPNKNNKSSSREGDWKVKTGRFAKNSTHNSKSRAVERAKRLGRSNWRGVTVHRSNGTVHYGFRVKQDASYGQGKATLVRSSK